MTGIFKLFLEAGVMASVMTGVVLLIRRVFAHRMRPGVMTALWALVLLRLCLPFTLASPVRLVSIPQPAAYVNAAAQTPQTPQTAAWSSLPGSGETNVTSAAPAAPQAEYNDAVAKTPAATDKAAPPPGIAFDAWDICAAVWLAGMAATLLLFLKKTRQFLRKLRICKPVTDERIISAIRFHKRQAGVKRTITIIECDFVHSPMVFGYFKPRILIPSRFFDMDGEALSAILLHEICHIRRHDILSNYIWLAAKALHWFNPLVWLAFECYEDDIELCRDEDAMRMLDAAPKHAAVRSDDSGALCYSMSLLEAARLSRQAAPVASAAALFESTRKLKTRIVRLVEPQKKKKSFVILSAALALVMLLGCFTTACQPTPVTPPVAGKNTDLVKLVVDASGNEAELTGDKRTIEEQIGKLGGRLKMEAQPGERITINADAQIVSRGFSRIPFVRIRPKNFTQQQFEAFTKYIADAQPLYTMDPEKGMMTKEELDIVLTHIKELLKNDALPQSAKDSWDFMLQQMELDRESAISRADETPYDWKPIPSGDSQTGPAVTYLKCYMDKDRAAWFDLHQSADGNNVQMSFNNNDYTSMYNTFEPYGGADAERINVSYEQAKAAAEELVRAADGEDTSFTLGESSIGYNIGTLLNYTKETSPQSYRFTFYRSYGGIEAKAVMYLAGAAVQSEYGEQLGEIDYNRQISPESFVVIVDSDGINQAYWLNQTEDIETVAEDVPLLDFDTVKGIFENYCKNRFSWAPPYDGMPEDLGTTLNVKRIELNLMATPEKDNLENFITVPVWDFIADQEYDREVVDANGYVTEPQRM